ncbi:hypothetical protein PAXRUDRAFT_20216 [Paxillus rubicundulus Ve08.2h10]|uniref:Uncharacterized protein n=1 Tax=Paxillus rubicundulus Ve08.2h10 TaxID=930991 RepID=A0A0D0BRH6_9AGAM|nr:hypothetical protein PAXRUDRAFT_21543 [Paxillus rubicundulus Ve08.2h10]KIK74097.1 hypothetical protein PAXRUDRAFT_20216 [Paxillus rubicundulus Ve08.2h10]
MAVPSSHRPPGALLEQLRNLASLFAISAPWSQSPIKAHIENAEESIDEKPLLFT